MPKAHRPRAAGLWKTCIAVGRSHEAVEDPWFAPKMPCPLHDLEVGAGPGPAEMKGGVRRAHHIVSPLHDRAGDPGEAMGPIDHVFSIEPCAMRKEVIFDSRKGNGKVRIFEMRC